MINTKINIMFLYNIIPKDKTKAFIIKISIINKNIIFNLMNIIIFFMLAIAFFSFSLYRAMFNTIIFTRLCRGF